MNRNVCAALADQSNFTFFVGLFTDVNRDVEPKFGL